MAPGMMLGQDENSWAFDGYNVRFLHLQYLYNHFDSKIIGNKMTINNIKSDVAKLI